MSCCRFSHPMVNAIHHPTCHLQIMLSSSGSVGSTRGEELWRPSSLLRAIHSQQLDHVVKATLTLESGGAPRRASLSCFIMGAPASRKSNQSAFSGGTEILCHPGGGPAPGCLVKGIVRLSQPVGYSSQPVTIAHLGLDQSLYLKKGEQLLGVDKIIIDLVSYFCP
jgi:hypothetical protein